MNRLSLDTPGKGKARRAAISLLVIGLLAALVGCGQKGPLKPPAATNSKPSSAP